MSHMRSHHGAGAFHRGINAPQSRFYDSGKFGRLFPTLPSLQADIRAVRALGQRGGPMDPSDRERHDNHEIDAGFVFFGQFVDHDITFDPTSSLERQNDPEAIQNFRTPLLELDSVYGSGPDVNPHLYSQNGDYAGELLIDRGFPRDLPRNSENTALIGDPRNDENLVICQLQLAFLKFHNAVLRQVKNFTEAQKQVRWHYQWLVLHEFLPKIVGKELFHEVYKPGEPGEGRRFFNWRHQPFIPVEFAVAAYRFGHAQVPSKLQVNDEFRVNGSHRVPLFNFEELGDSDPDDLSGFGQRAERRYVHWPYLFHTGHDLQQPSKLITSQLSSPLFRLPFFEEQGQISSLAERNLLRGHRFGLPSGQAVARAMGVDVLLTGDLQELRWLEYTDPQTGESEEINDTGLDIETPLWYYILKEAELDDVAQGAHLGPVGGRIVAEVIVGLLEGDRLSFVRADPNWKPALGDGETFTMRDMLEYAGVLETETAAPQPA